MKKTLAQAGASWQEVAADLFDKTALLVPPKIHYRLTSQKGRLYYTLDDQEQGGEPIVTVFLSVNTICDAVLPTSRWLIDWWKQHGVNADAIASAAADFGTFEHYLLSQYYVEGKLPMLRRRRSAGVAQAEKDLLDIATTYIAQNHPGKYDASDWAHRASRDLAALHAFDLDFGYQPIFVEGILSGRVSTPSGDLLIAGAVDTVGFLQAKGGKLAIMDWKSGQHDNKGNKKYQLALRLYKLLFEMNYPHLGPVEKLYNVSPKKWVKSASYNLDDQTDAISEREFDLLLELAALSAHEPRATLRRVVGELVRGSNEGVEIEELDLEQQILYGHKSFASEADS